MTAQTGPVELLEVWWIVAAVALPLIYPFFVRADAAAWFKFAVSITLSTGVAVVSMWPFDGFEWTAGAIANRVLVFAGIVQVAYKAADLLVTAWLNEYDRGLNDHDLYRPERGLSERTLRRGRL